MNDPKLIVSLTKPSLEAAQKMVGGLVQLIELPNEDQLLVNEEGLFGEAVLNIQASILACEPIVGDAVLLQGDNRWD